MSRAYNFGRWAGQLLNRMPHSFGGALVLLLIGAVVGATIVMVSRTDRGLETPSVSAPASQSPPSPEEIEKAAADAAREQEQERQREMERQETMNRLRKAALDKSRDDAKACASLVRQRSDARTYKGFSSFDAFVTGEYGETFQYFGTAAERFQFEKCMADRGVPLSTKTDAKK